MIIAIIRSYDKDDMSAYLCYQSMKKHAIASKYIFWHDEGERLHPFISSTGEEIKYHEPAGNFGGLLYVKIMLKELKKMGCNIYEHDQIIFCDADVVFIDNPFNYITDDIDHAGKFGSAEVCPGIPHISGQVNILKGWLWNKWISDEKNAEDMHKYQSEKGGNAGTTDDTLLSIFSHLQGAKAMTLWTETFKCWDHPVKVADKKELNELCNKYLCK